MMFGTEDVKMSRQQFCAMLGILPSENAENFEVIIKNVKSGTIVKQLSVDELFEGVYKLPVNLATL